MEQRENVTWKQKKIRYKKGRIAGVDILQKGRFYVSSSIFGGLIFYSSSTSAFKLPEPKTWKGGSKTWKNGSKTWKGGSKTWKGGSKFIIFSHKGRLSASKKAWGSIFLLTWPEGRFYVSSNCRRILDVYLPLFDPESDISGLTRDIVSCVGGGSPIWEF